MFLSITISTYSFDQISTCMIVTHSFTGLGISSKLIVSLSRSNISVKQVDSDLTVGAILFSRVTQLGHTGLCHPFGFQGCHKQTQL